MQNTGQYPNGGWLAFDSSADAQVEATRRQVGVVVDANGRAEAKQPWSSAHQMGAQLENPRFTTQVTPGKHNVWFPPDYASSTGSTDPKFTNGGAFLAFDSAADAQEHVKARGGWGVILDPASKLDATQPWKEAGRYAFQLSNGDLTRSRKAGKVSVWFPVDYLNNIGVQDEKPFAHGAYLSFASLAQRGCRSR